MEQNEAFATQALAVIRELDLPMERTNPNGSGISLANQVAAPGCLFAVKVLYELRRKGGKYTLVVLCMNGGKGIAAIFEAISLRWLLHQLVMLDQLSI